jgi:hypothetical protein
MNHERWLTLPRRAGVRSPELKQLFERLGNDYAKAWDTCEDPKLLTEMAAAAGLPVELVLGAASKACTDAWNHWSGGATDPRPMQIVASISRWLRRDAGFEEVWGTWELAERLSREVRQWYETQQGAVLARAILGGIDSVYSLATTARNLAEPEPGHDQYDPARYEKKNNEAANAGLLHDAADSVRLAVSAGAWWHTHSEPRASDADHDIYAKQILGFVIRQNLNAEDVVQGMRERLRGL